MVLPLLELPLLLRLKRAVAEAEERQVLHRPVAELLSSGFPAPHRRVGQDVPEDLADKVAVLAVEVVEAQLERHAGLVGDDVHGPRLDLARRGWQVAVAAELGVPFELQSFDLTDEAYEKFPSPMKKHPYFVDSDGTAEKVAISS